MSFEQNNNLETNNKIEVGVVDSHVTAEINNTLYCDEVLEELNNNNIDNVINSLTSGTKFVQLDNTNLEEYNNDILKIKEFINSANKLDNGEKEQIIAALAVNLGLGYNTLLAMAYTEEPTEIIIHSQATEKPTERGNVYINLSNESIGGGRSSYTEYYTQEGNVSIDREVISGAVLDFTGSMEKDQLEGMLMAIQELAQSGTINENTSFNIMYNVPNMQGDAFNRSTIRETQQLTQNIQYGQNGEGLKAALLNLGLIRITNGERHIVDGIDGKGSTPLYDTILKNLMNSNVRNCVVFTDGSSDTANIGTGEEELGNTESWDQMIRLCRDYNKTIKIIVFNNSNSVYRNRIQEMEEYFRTHGGLNYLSFGKQNDGQILGGQDLSNWLQNSLTNTMDNTTIRISEDENVALHQINAQYVNDGTSTTISQKPEGFPKNFDGTIVFDGEGYNINLQEIFGNIDFSKYDLYYEIFSENGIKGAYQFNNVLNENDMTLFDLSQISNGYVGNIMKSQYRNSYFFQKNGQNHETKTINNITDINMRNASDLINIINSLANTNEYPINDGCVLNLFSSCYLGDMFTDTPENIRQGRITINQTKENLRTLLCEKHLTLNIYDCRGYEYYNGVERYKYANNLTQIIMMDVENIISYSENREERKEQLIKGMLNNDGQLKSYNQLNRQLEENPEIFANTIVKEYKDKKMLTYFYSFVNRIITGRNSGYRGAYTCPGLDGGRDFDFKKDFVENHIYNGTNGRGKINIYAAEIDEQGRIGERGEAFGLPTGYTRTAMSLRLTPKEGTNAPNIDPKYLRIVNSNN